VTYEGALVRLRAMEPADAAAQHRWFNDPEVVRHLTWRYPISATALAARLDGAPPMGFAGPRFSVERRDTGELVGYAALRDVTPESRNADLDLVIGERGAWGQGLGTDTARAVCAFAFDAIGLHRVTLLLLADNAAAVRVAEKAGFAHEGRLRERFLRGGQRHDALLMGRLADDDVTA
jgi:RimJ/RimL family protein N-acetyltransferase